jgi:hypothetical protein
VVDWCYIFSISKLGVYPLSVTVYNVVYYLTISLLGEDFSTENDNELTRDGAVV